MNRIGRIVLVVLLGLTTCVAQTITGAITGTVTDPSGASMPNVAVTGTQEGTNLSYKATTNSAGVYTLPFLPVGGYTVTAQAPGFKKVVLGPFALEVGQTARVDVKMEIGEVTQSVEIRDFAPILQTQSTQTGDTITATQAAALPLNGRNFASLTLLVPGAISAAPKDFNGAARAGGRPFVNGNREQTNNFLLDGADVNESMDNGIGYSPNVDALAEVKVMTGNASAEFGNANGAIVNMTFKSGTNALHGNVFETLRNDKLDANDFFQNKGGAKKRAFRRNVFGGTLGGPIKHDRLFFFMDYQASRQRDSGPALASVAPAEWRTGDLSRIPRVIRDPTKSGNCTTADRTACFPNNQIPASQIVNPVARALFGNPQLYPLANQAGTGPIGVSSNYVSRSGSGLDNDQADAKVDWRFTDKDQLSARFSIARYRQGSTAVALPVLLGSAANNPTTGGVLGWTRTVSATTVNEARLAFTQVVTNDDRNDPFGLLGNDGNQKLGIPGGQPIVGMSSITLGDGLSTIGNGAAISSTVDNHYQYTDNLTMQQGRHLLKMGVQFLRYQQNRFYAGNNGALGFFSYTGEYSGSAFADFLLNQLREKGRGSVTGKWGHRQWRNALFFQDDFRVRGNLTVNLGLRWEYTQPFYEVADRQANVDLITGKALFAGKDGNSRALYNPYWKQFMPRIGFAWLPGIFSNHLVVRGGYGITSYMEGTGGNLRLPLNPPFFFESDTVFDLSKPGDIRTGFADVTPLNTLSGQVRAWNPDLRPAFIQQWNLSTEYQFSNTFSLTTGYVGQRGTQLVVPREYNQPLPDPGPVSTWRLAQFRRRLYSVAPDITNISGTDSSANMNYHSLQVSGRKRMGGGLEFISAYTWSKTLTDNRGFYGKGAYLNTEGAYWQDAYNRRGDWGPAFFDVTHNFTLGGTYQLPFGKDRAMGKGWNRPVDLVLGGWSIGYITAIHTGFPITITSNDRSSQNTRGATRPNRYATFTYSGQTIDQWFGTGNTNCLAPGVNDGTCAYGDPAAGTFGNSQKGTERGPDFANIDLSIGKQFRVTERQRVDFNASFFNALNHPAFGVPARNIDQPSNFGQITQQVNDPRIIQFALKYSF